MNKTSLRCVAVTLNDVSSALKVLRVSEFHREDVAEFCEWNSQSAISEQNCVAGSYENA